MLQQNGSICRSTWIVGKGSRKPNCLHKSDPTSCWMTSTSRKVQFKHAKKVWKTFGQETLGDYHDLYLKTDICLLAYIFLKFRTLNLKQYRLHPAHYYTSPGLSWDTMLKKIGVQLELLTDVDMHLFIEQGTCGGISVVSKQYAKANNPCVKDYDPNNPNNYIQYLDAHNHYSCAMCKPLLKGKFAWKTVMPTEEQMCMRHTRWGWILEADLEYLAKLHRAHNGYPLAPEKRKSREWISDYQKTWWMSWGWNTMKQSLSWRWKTKRTISCITEICSFLNQGMKLKKVHRVLQFDQECWMEPYNRMNTEFQKQAKNEFEKNFYNLMNNSVLAKTMENVQKQVHNTIVCRDEREKICKLIVSPLFGSCTLFFQRSRRFRMHKECMKLDKPFYAGMIIFDVSKTLIYDF